MRHCPVGRAPRWRQRSAPFPHPSNRQVTGAPAWPSALSRVWNTLSRAHPWSDDGEGSGRTPDVGVWRDFRHTTPSQMGCVVERGGGGPAWRVGVPLLGQQHAPTPVLCPGGDVGCFGPSPLQRPRGDRGVRPHSSGGRLPSFSCFFFLVLVKQRGLPPPTHAHALGPVRPPWSRTWLDSAAAAGRRRGGAGPPLWWSCCWRCGHTPASHCGAPHPGPWPPWAVAA